MQIHGEVIQAGLETSNASGENVQRHIPIYEPNTAQLGLINSADGTERAVLDKKQFEQNPLESTPIINNKPIIHNIDFVPTSTGIFGLTPLQAGLGLVGITAGVCAIIYFWPKS